MFPDLDSIPGRISDFPALFDELVTLYKKAGSENQRQTAVEARGALSALMEAEAALFKLDAAENILIGGGHTMAAGR